MSCESFTGWTARRLIDQDRVLLELLPPIQRFLNRVLALPTQVQNALFAGFLKRIADQSERARAAGMPDLGTGILHSEMIRQTPDEDPWTCPRSEAVSYFICLCMLAYHVEWLVRRDLVPIRFEDDDREGAPGAGLRSSSVEPALVSESAGAKAVDKRTPGGLPVHCFNTLLADLGTQTLNHASLPGRPDSRFLMATEPTGRPARACEPLGMGPARDDSISVTA